MESPDYALCIVYKTLGIHGDLNEVPARLVGGLPYYLSNARAPADIRCGRQQLAACNGERRGAAAKPGQDLRHRSGGRAAAEVRGSPQGLGAARRLRGGEGIRGGWRRGRKGRTRSRATLEERQAMDHCHATDHHHAMDLRDAMDHRDAMDGMGE
eukprot:gene14096-biopygen5744